MIGMGMEFMAETIAQKKEEYFTEARSQLKKAIVEQPIDSVEDCLAKPPPRLGGAEKLFYFKNTAFVINLVVLTCLLCTFNSWTDKVLSLTNMVLFTLVGTLLFVVKLKNDIVNIFFSAADTYLPIITNFMSREELYEEIDKVLKDGEVKAWWEQYSTNKTACNNSLINRAWIFLWNGMACCALTAGTMACCTVLPLVLGFKSGFNDIPYVSTLLGKVPARKDFMSTALLILHTTLLMVFVFGTELFMYSFVFSKAKVISPIQALWYLTSDDWAKMWENDKNYMQFNLVGEGPSKGWFPGPNPAGEVYSGGYTPLVIQAHSSLSGKADVLFTSVGESATIDLFTKDGLHIATGTFPGQDGILTKKHLMQRIDISTVEGGEGLVDEAECEIQMTGTGTPELLNLHLNFVPPA